MFKNWDIKVKRAKRFGHRHTHILFSKDLDRRRILCIYPIDMLYRELNEIDLKETVLLTKIKESLAKIVHTKGIGNI